MGLLGRKMESEAQEIRRFFESLPESERHRLLVLFAQMLERPDPIATRGWVDTAPDGDLKVPIQIPAVGR